MTTLPAQTRVKARQPSLVQCRAAWRSRLLLVPATGIARLVLGAAVASSTAAPHTAQAAAAAALAVPSTPVAPATVSLAPFLAHYTADWKSINVGTSDLELKPDTGADRYVYTWTVTARGIFRMIYPNDVTQKSWFSVAGDHVRPERYRADDGSATVSIDFDWEAGRAHGIAEKKPVDMKLQAGTQDVLSIQTEVMLNLKNGTVPKSFFIVDKDEVKEFVYTQEGTAKLRTALGILDTVIVSSRHKGGNRVLRMWFAPSLNFVPVQAERTRDGKLEFAMRIKTLTSSAK